jgi:hypothetical protein
MSEVAEAPFLAPARPQIVPAELGLVEPVPEGRTTRRLIQHPQYPSQVVESVDHLFQAWKTVVVTEEVVVIQVVKFLDVVAEEVFAHDVLVTVYVVVIIQEVIHAILIRLVV